MKRKGIICFLFILFISIFSGAYVKEAYASTHAHTDDCYNGTKHTHTGNSSSGGGCYGTYQSGSRCGSSLYYWETHSQPLSFKCSSCTYGYASGSYTYDVYRCYNGHSVSVTKIWYWSCNICGSSYNRSSDSPPSSCTSTTAGYYSLSCGKTAGSYYSGNTLVSPTCDQVITSISPNAGTQSIYYNGSIDSTCTATYLDGHTGTVSCTASGFNKSSLGAQTVTLTYSGLVTNAKTTGSLTAKVNVTVVDYVSAISATSGTQSVYYGGSIVSTATITKASGGTSTVPCTVSGFSNTTVGSQIVTLTYTGMSTNTGAYPSCTSSVTVLPGLTSITPTYSNQTIYKGGTPVLTTTAAYMDGSTKTVTPSNNFNSSAIGTQTVMLSYTDQGITKTASCTVTVKPNLTNLAVTANKVSVLYNTDIAFTCTAYYEDGSNRVVSATNASPYQKTTVGSQTVSFSYSENGITKNAGVSVVVLDYPTALNVNLTKKQIYQTQSISIQSSTVTLASGATQSVTPAINSYDNMTVGNEDITFSYELNGISVSNVVTIEVLADLYGLKLSSDSLTIYKGQDLNLTVYAEFNINGEVKLSPSDFTITGFDKDVYDRAGRYYTLSYTNKGVTINKTLFIIVLPNVTSINVSYPAQTTEGILIPFVAKLTYEDARVITLTEADLGKFIGLSIENYDLNQVGYQNIIIKYQEGGITVSQTARIRVRAIIKVSIPISALISINSNTGQVYSPSLSIDNQSKESVMIGISSIDKGASGLIDVLPDQYSDWARLGKSDSKNIAVGIYYDSDNWMSKDLADPLYIVEAKDTVIGIINKGTTTSLEFQIKHGNSFENNMSFQYVIQWTIRLAEE